MSYRKNTRPPYNARLREMRSRYAAGVAADSNEFLWAVMNCYFRKGLTLADTADVLNSTTDNIDLAIDNIQQKGE